MDANGNNQLWQIGGLTVRHAHHNPRDISWRVFMFALWLGVWTLIALHDSHSPRNVLCS